MKTPEEMLEDYILTDHPSEGQVVTAWQSARIAKEYADQFKPEWVPISERFPDNPNNMQACLVENNGKLYRQICFFINKRSEELFEFDDPDDFDYDEESDIVYFPEGWYVSDENKELYYKIEPKFWLDGIPEQPEL